MFRSPKERTPEFYAPKLTNDGHFIGIKNISVPKSRHQRVRVSTSLAKQERFLDYKYLAQKTSIKVGPGTYKDFENFMTLRK
jgi:hypothetical protein